MDTLLQQFGEAVGGLAAHPVVRITWMAIGLYVVLLWLACAWWVLQDLRRRHPDPGLPILAASGVVLASPILFPLALVVYRIVRPSETLVERHERLLTDRLTDLEREFALSCPGCGAAVEESWLACPGCRTRLAHRCVECNRSMGLDWVVCAWCGGEFGQAALADPGPARAMRAIPVVAEAGPYQELPVELPLELPADVPMELPVDIEPARV